MPTKQSMTLSALTAAAVALAACAGPAATTR